MGNEGRQIFIKYVSFNVFGMLALSLYYVVDTIFIAQALGREGLASLNYAIPLFGVVHASGLMIGVGGAIRYNVFKSQHQQQKANHIFTSTLLLGGVISLVYIALGLFFHESLTRFLGATQGDKAFMMTASYIRIVLVFSPLYVLSNILIAFIRNDGVPSIAMGGLLVASFFNITFDYVLLFVIPLGMLGAAIASSIGAFFGLMTLSLFFILKKNTVQLGHLKGFLTLWPVILVLGLPASLIDFSYSIVMSFFNHLLTIIEGITAVAAYSIIANLSLLSLAVFIGISQGVQPLLTQAYSLKDDIVLTKILKASALLIVFLSFAIYGLLFVFSDAVVALFNQDQDMRLAIIAKEGIRIYFIGLFFAGLNILYSAFYGAIEQPRLGLLIVLLRGLILVIPIGFLLSNLFGVVGVWFAFVAAESLTLVIAYLIFFIKATKRRQFLRAS